MTEYEKARERQSYQVPGIIITGVVQSIVYLTLKYDFQPFVHWSTVPDSTIAFATLVAGLVAYFLFAALKKSGLKEEERKWTGEEIFAAFKNQFLAAWICVVVILVSDILWS